MSLSWFGPQRIQGLTVLDPEGQAVLSVEEASTQLSLLGAIGGDLAAVCWALEELLECASPLLVGALLVPGGPKFFSSPSHCYR
jgi:hypothetical protein